MKQHSPQREVELPQQHFRDNGRLDDSNSHHTLPHLTPGSPAALPIPRADREATASVIASGHENGERDIAHSDHPGEHAKATAVTGSANSHDRSRQSDLGVAASGQKTATGHTETTRANAMKPLAVQRPRKGKQQTRRSTPTASRPANRARKAERQREQQDRSREPSDRERAQSTFPSRRSGSQGGILTGAELGRVSRLTTSQSVQR